MLALVSAADAAENLKLPHLSFASIDWPAAMATVTGGDMGLPAAMSAKSRLANPMRKAPAALVRLNGVMSQQFAGLATSPVPVLLPFDVDGLLRDVILNRIGSAAIHGVHWHYTRPPIDEVEFEMDLRCVRTEIRL